MKSRKEIARLANELTQALEQSTDDKVFLKIVAYGKDALTKRQIAPQVIMEKMVTASYEAVLRGKGKIKMSAETLAILKQMEELSRTRSILPFRRYDPWD
ncbi:hypothetical protein D6C19_03840 [Ligilactobacillus murinus]|uniref:Bacteriocin immunity protein n=1 Tax=Ligilactobacillus murinus TaxID=1622 RepID=A0A4Q2AWX3_9LACO|nr:hypothetical protein [Ligilactobacillus murinus]NBH85253.1 hypothetical protein [Lachnospiraceae bacterium]RXV74823.1 hypothetical protein D6C19_03840 [Ligilactobacillus murinus]